MFKDRLSFYVIFGYSVLLLLKVKGYPNQMMKTDGRFAKLREANSELN